MKRNTAFLLRSPRTYESQQIAWVYACILIVFAVSQLVSFAWFVPLVNSFQFPGVVTGVAVAIMLVVSEVAAVPFLLRMTMPRIFHWLSMIAGWIAAGLWLLITVWLIVSGVNSGNVGMLGTGVQLLPGVWAVFFSISLCLASAWASWGLWPGRRKLERKR